MGRRSKLAQEFTTEFLKQTKESSSSSSRWEKNTFSPLSRAKTETVVESQSSPPPSKASYQPQTSSPIDQPVPLTAPVMPVAFQGVEDKSPHVGPRNEEEDTLSDAGTYTIEADIQDRELEEARSKIDQASFFRRLIYINPANNGNVAQRKYVCFAIHQCPLPFGRKSHSE